jgi:hypothetical protein
MVRVLRVCVCMLSCGIPPPPMLMRSGAVLYSSLQLQLTPLQLDWVSLIRPI